MQNAPACASCGTSWSGVTIPVQTPKTVHTWALCPRCWLSFRVGWAIFFPAWPMDHFLAPQAPPYWTAEQVELFIAEGGREVVRRRAEWADVPGDGAPPSRLAI